MNVDSIAQESNETFALTLQLSSIDHFGAGANIRNRLEGVILDSDGKFNKQCYSIVVIFITSFCPPTVISFELTTAEYIQKEEPNALMEVLIIRSRYSQLANPVYLSITPLTVDDALSRGIISEYDDENRYSPNRASKRVQM